MALHLAAQALRNRECDLALAGGATVMATPTAFIEFSRQRGLAPDGRCKSYSDQADGVGWSEGAGILVLERLSDARANGHPVLASVRGSAVNQDGRSQGLTAPNGPSQQRVVEAALASAGLMADEIDLLEGHGTGTRLGDPIEVGALEAVFGERENKPLWLGSIKSNIGHTQAAAGVAGVIKVVLAMQHRMLPRSLYAEARSKNAEWSGGIELLVDNRAWDSEGKPRRAGVSSFGISGTNAHVIVEQVEQVEVVEVGTAIETPTRMPVPLVVCARDEVALQRQARGLHDALVGSLDLADVSHALLTRRTQFEHRAAIVVRSHEQATEALRRLAAGDGGLGLVSGRVEGSVRLALLFTGQGSQRAGMGRELYEHLPAFRVAFDQLCACFDEHLERPLKEVVFSDRAKLLDRTMYTQPALFALEVALLRALEHYGVRAQVVLGHSIGELAAAHVAGLWDLADACKLVATRSVLMEALPEGGAMISIAASELEVREAIASAGVELDIAGINGPRSTVVSGEARAAEVIAEHFESRGKKVRRLEVSHAFHSVRMQPMLAAFGEVAESLRYGELSCRLISNVTGREIGREQVASAEYWTKHVRDPVRFLDGVRAVEEAGVTVTLELGPRGVLTAMAAECWSTRGESISTSACLHREESELESFVRTLAYLHCNGVEVNWTRWFEEHVGVIRPVELPTYAFAREHYWLEAPKLADGGRMSGAESTGHPLLSSVVAVVEAKSVLFTGELSIEAQPWLDDHRVHGRVIVPGTVFVELAGVASRRLGLPRIEELSLEVPLAVPDVGAIALQLFVLEDAAEGARAFVIHSRASSSSAEWTRHARGILVEDDEHEHEPAPVWPPESAKAIVLDGAYERLGALGLDYGASFRGLRSAWIRGQERHAELRLPSEAGSREGYAIHPVLFDAALHVLALGRRAEEIELPSRGLVFAFMPRVSVSCACARGRLRMVALGSSFATRWGAWLRRSSG